MKKALLILGGIVLFVAAIIWSLPASHDNDLSQIGNGKKSLVFIYDINRVVSNQQTIEISNAKTKRSNAANYLVVRTGYPETEQLMRQYNAKSVEVLFFDEKGELFARKFALVDAHEILLTLQL